MSHLVGNPEDRFSRVAAQLVLRGVKVSLLKDATLCLKLSFLWCQWGLNPGPLDTVLDALAFGHHALPCYEGTNDHSLMNAFHS